MKNRGFTLVELLVVIAIISLLSSIAFASFSSAREKAAVAKNTAQGNEIRKSVEVEYESLLSNVTSSFTNTNLSTPIEQKADIAKVLFPETEGLDATPGSGSSSSIATEIGDKLPKVPKPISKSDRDDDYYYLSDGSIACSTSGSNCIPLRCGNINETSSSYQADPYVIAYKFTVPSGTDPEDVAGYDENKILMAYAGGVWQKWFWTQNTYQCSTYSCVDDICNWSDCSTYNEGGHYQCI